MYSWKTSCWLGLMLSVGALFPRVAAAQTSETLSISGTFNTSASTGTLGSDLAGVAARGHDHVWTLSLQGVVVEREYKYEDWLDLNGDYSYAEQHITRIYAASFDIEFFGPDADVLNSAVSSQLTIGGLNNDGIIELVNLDYQEPAFWWESGPYSIVTIRLSPADTDEGVSFWCDASEFSRFLPTDAENYPLVEQFRFYPTVRCQDLRSENNGWLGGESEVVDFGSDIPPTITPRISIADGSILEGNQGTTRLSLPIRLSSASSQSVTVKYQTVAATATPRKDYAVSSGVVTFLPGQTSRTITLDIKTDRKREPDESFQVLLTSPAGATVADADAVVTILNDD